MQDGPDDRQTPQPDAPPLVPLGLDYFAVNAPDRRESRATVFWTTWLALGWLPYLCGVVNALVVAQSYSPLVTRPHNIGAMAFMGVGLLMSVIALGGFARRRHWAGALSALLLLALQTAVAGCMAVSSF